MLKNGSMSCFRTAAIIVIIVIIFSQIKTGFSGNSKDCFNGYMMFKPNLKIICGLYMPKLYLSDL